jgi:hypothetical protein
MTSAPDSPGRRFPWPPVLLILAIALVVGIQLIIERSAVKQPPQPVPAVAVTVTQPRSFAAVDVCTVLTATEIDALFGRDGLAVPAAYSGRTGRYEACSLNGERGTGSVVFNDLDHTGIPFSGYHRPGHVELIGGNTAFVDITTASGGGCDADVVLTNSTTHTMLSIGTTGFADVGPISCDQVRAAASAIVDRLPTAPS